MAGRRIAEPHSRRFALDGADLRKLGTGLLIALVGAVATFLSDASTSLDFGPWSPFISMAISVVVNAIRKWMADNSTPPLPDSAPASGPSRTRSVGGTTGTIVLALTGIMLGLMVLAALGGKPETSGERHDGVPADIVPAEDLDAVTRAFVLQRQLFARVCLEAARRERAGVITTEEAENAWCEPRWAAARSEAFGVLVESRDRQLREGWTPSSSAAGLEAWAVAADPTLEAEVTRHE